MSAKKQSKSDKEGAATPPPPPPPMDRNKKGRSSDLGRALRTVYDDTLRESVPDEFTDLLGKLD